MLNYVPLRLSQVKFSMVKIYLTYIGKTTKNYIKEKKIIGHHERKKMKSTLTSLGGDRIIRYKILYNVDLYTAV